MSDFTRKIKSANIGNPGTFHFGLTPERLTIAHESRPWNPLIARVLYRAGIIERWGTGTLNIMDCCQENHAPVPNSNYRDRLLFLS
jgi:predicted HTH transcriptional regulator